MSATIDEGGEDMVTRRVTVMGGGDKKMLMVMI
jgi:hypothetical protein